MARFRVKSWQLYFQYFHEWRIIKGLSSSSCSHSLLWPRIPNGYAGIGEETPKNHFSPSKLDWTAPFPFRYSRASQYSNWGSFCLIAQHFNWAVPIRHCCFGKFSLFLSVVLSHHHHLLTVSTQYPFFLQYPLSKKLFILRASVTLLKTSLIAVFYSSPKIFQHGSFPFLTIILYGASSKDWAGTNGGSLREI